MRLKRFVRMAAALGIALAGLVAPAVAQSEADFVKALKGQWEVFDDTYALEGKHCLVELADSAPADGKYALSVAHCGLELGLLTGWKIVDNQLALLAGDDIVATLGGNQLRMSGTSSIGAPVILDRAGSNGAMAAILKARQSSGCYYLGFTTTCVDDAQLAKPAVPSDGSAAKISVLVNLNVRAEARDDGEVVGVVPANSCIVTDVCASAADGVWCRARFGDVGGWLKKLALRQERWPVVTFVNQCSAP